MKTHTIIWTLHPAAALVEKYAAEWDALNSNSADIPFLSTQCIGSALREFGTGNELLALGRSNGELVSALVLNKPEKFKCKTFQPSQLLLAAVLAKSGLGLEEIASSLLGMLPITVLALTLTQIDPLMFARPPETAASESVDYIESGWVELKDDSFDAYWDSRGKNLRQNLRKQRNKLAEANTACTMTLHDQPEAMSEAMKRYSHLESTGWKATQGTAVTPENAQGRFYLSVFEAACQRGEARVYEYCFDDRTVAMDLCLLRQGTLVILKTAYDESIDKSLSPAFLLRQDEMQQLYAERRVVRIEFYGRFMEWHGRWTDLKRTLFHFSQFRWSAVRQARDLMTSLMRSRESTSTPAEVASSSAAPASATTSERS